MALCLVIPISELGGGGGVPTPPIYYPPAGIATPPIYYPPVDPGYGRPVLPPHVGGGPIVPPVYPGGVPVVPPGVVMPPIYYPPHVGGGPVYPGRPVDPGYGRPGWLPIDPGYGQRPPVDPGYGQPKPPGWGGGTPENPIVLPPDQELPPGTPSAPIWGGWTIAFLPGTGWVLVPPPQGLPDRPEPKK